MTHTHIDIGGGYCRCGAEHCSLPSCDSWCKHLFGWIEVDELRELRRPDIEKLLKESL